MDDRRSTIGARKAVAFDVESQPQEHSPPSPDLPDESSSSNPAGDNEEKKKQEEEEEAENQWDDEEYDPYHGLGLRDRPDLPLLLVFNLMESRRFNKFSSPLRAKLFYVGAILGGVSLASAMLFCLALLIFQLRELPQLPLVNVKSVSYGIAQLYDVQPEVILRQQQEGKGNYFAYKLNYICEIQMLVTNPNRHLDIQHHSIEVTSFYQGMALAVDRLQDIPHPRRSVIRPFFRALAIGLPLPLKVGHMLITELNDQRLRATGPTGVFIWPVTQMVVEIIFHSEISLLQGVKRMPFRWRCRCKIFDILAYTQGFRCHCLDAKWRPREHLKHYRLPSWETDYTQITSPVFQLPDDYYDPAINYFGDFNLTASYYGNYYPYHP